MNTVPLSLYKVIEFGLGGDSWQGFVDRYLEKYEGLTVDGFDFEPLTLNYTFSQLITSLGVTALPAYVDPESPGYEGALQTITGATGNIPTMKKFYRLNRVTMQYQLQLLQRLGTQALDDRMKDAFMNLLDESTEGLIKAYYNALTHQRMQIVSNGQFTIDSTNNPRGLKGITIGFNIPSDNFDTLTDADLWWTDAEHVTANEGGTADPIMYLKNRVKAIRRTYHYYGALTMEISEDLWDDLLTHSAVLTRLGHVLYPNVTDDATVLANAENVDESTLGELIRKLVKVDKIVTRDTYAYVDAPGTDADGLPDLVSTQIENFNSKNVAFIPSGTIGGIQGVEPLTLGYDTDKVASYDGGRLKLTQRANPETHSIYIESEAAQLCVPRMPQYMFISTVTA